MGITSPKETRSEIFNATRSEQNHADLC